MDYTILALVIFSALLHSAWNMTVKIAKDKGIFLFHSMSLACFLVFVAIFCGRDGFAYRSTPAFWYSIFAGVFLGGYLTCTVRGLEKASLALAYSVMRGGAMVLVWVFSLTFSREHPHIFGMIGCALVLLGLLYMGIDRSLRKNLHRHQFFWPLMGAFFIAGYHLCYDEAVKIGADTKTLFFSAVLTSLLPFFFSVARKNFLGRSVTLLKTEKFIVLCAALGVSFGFLIFLEALKQIGPGTAITMRNVSIFFSLGLSIYIGDKVSRKEIMGAVAIGLGVSVLGMSEVGSQAKESQRYLASEREPTQSHVEARKFQDIEKLKLPSRLIEKKK